MATHDVTTPRVGRPADTRTTGIRRLATETKAAIKTTEFYAYVVVLAATLIAGLVTKAGSGDATGGGCLRRPRRRGRSWLSGGG